MGIKDNYGPIWIPQAGTAVALTADNLPLYRRIIETYEGNDLVWTKKGRSSSTANRPTPILSG